MKTNKRAAADAIRAKARKVVAFADEFVKTAKNQADLRNALYNAHGVMRLVFATHEERRAFRKTREYRHLLALIEGLPPGPMLAEEYKIHVATGQVSKRPGASSV